MRVFDTIFDKILNITGTVFGAMFKGLYLVLVFLWHMIELFFRGIGGLIVLMFRAVWFVVTLFFTLIMPILRPIGVLIRPITSRLFTQRSFLILNLALILIAPILTGLTTLASGRGGESILYFGFGVVIAIVMLRMRREIATILSYRDDDEDRYR